MEGGRKERHSANGCPDVAVTHLAYPGAPRGPHPEIVLFGSGTSQIACLACV